MPSIEWKHMQTFMAECLLNTMFINGKKNLTHTVVVTAFEGEGTEGEPQLIQK